MYNNANVTFDFTNHSALDNITAQQPVAVMPAGLAKKLLKMYARNMRSSTSMEIISRHIADLKECAEQSDLQGAIEASLGWIVERELVENISAENWDAYAVRIETPMSATV